MTWFNQLSNKRGSQPRCVLMMDGPRATVAERLTKLVNIPDVTISSNDVWMPHGKPVKDASGNWDKAPAEEAKLDVRNKLLEPNVSAELKDWWLVKCNGANTPNWDIASTCKIDGRKGLLLVEAKAHDSELLKAEAGKPGGGNLDNYKRIHQCIEEANRGLLKCTGVGWNLSLDSHYQMSNRFAWSWKLAQMGFPVVLVYLGFLNANEMQERGKPFTKFEEWELLVQTHSAPLFPASVWRKVWTVNRQPLLPLIRVYEQAFP